MDKARTLARGRERQRGTITSVRELIARHPGEWLAIALKAEERGQPKLGQLIYHAKDRDAVWQKTRSRKRLYIVYAGPALKNGYAAAF